MKATTKSAEDVWPGESLEQVKDRFALWRKGRKRGERISNALWASAVGLVAQHGLQRTAQELRVDCNLLKKHIARNAGSTRTAKAASQFVELFAQPASSAVPAAQCVVEMENARGGKMRVELGNIDGLAGLASAFWSAR
ncbi:hypothetical protein ACFQAT_13385 [Undibacterium arcticum]|uniref:Uncharacterized protein n=1 Tax=Undibacterium arcticum TaxID=1762892 RepID=A0ABV7F6H9_9BURK